MLIKRISNIQYCPYIRTEQTIFELLERDRNQISDDYELICLPLAHLINTVGIPRTNQLISAMKSNKQRVFVCQHIHVPYLLFSNDDIVFTPHASDNDNFISIPHYAVSQDKTLISEDRDILFSFIGSTTTHHTRKKIVELYDTCYDSGKHWGLETNDVEFKKKYIETLGSSKYSLCPRGTGISSVRTFESMSMGSFPVLISDGYQPPLKDIINWDEISISIPEASIDTIEDILKNKSLSEDKLKEVYNEYFSNENLHKTIIKELG